MLRDQDLAKLLSLVDGSEGNSDVIVIPWSVANRAGWETDPETVLELDRRKRVPNLNDAIKLRIILDPDHEILRNPTEPPEPMTWTPLQRERILSGPVSLFSLIPDAEDEGNSDD